MCAPLFCLLLLMSPGQPAPFQEHNGFVQVEAEAFHRQSSSVERSWLISDEDSKHPSADLDSLEHLTASAGTFVELLPDTRVTHDDPLIHGINFSGSPGLSVLEYDIEFETTGRYYVWVRAFSTGTEDNGIHVGIDDQWPLSGQRMQWCEGKNEWTWASKQRTEANHCGEPELIYLDIDRQGLHTIKFSMREDGFAFDQFVLTTTYEMP